MIINLLFQTKRVHSNPKSTHCPTPHFKMQRYDIFFIPQHEKTYCQWQCVDNDSGEVYAMPPACRKAIRFCPSQNRVFGFLMTDLGL